MLLLVTLLLALPSSQAPDLGQRSAVQLPDPPASFLSKTSMESDLGDLTSDGKGLVGNDVGYWAFDDSKRAYIEHWFAGLGPKGEAKAATESQVAHMDYNQASGLKKMHPKRVFALDADTFVVCCAQYQQRPNDKASLIWALCHRKVRGGAPNVCSSVSLPKGRWVSDIVPVLCTFTTSQVMLSLATVNGREVAVESYTCSLGKNGRWRLKSTYKVAVPKGHGSVRPLALSTGGALAAIDNECLYLLRKGKPATVAAIPGASDPGQYWAWGYFTRERFFLKAAYGPAQGRSGQWGYRPALQSLVKTGPYEILCTNPDWTAWVIRDAGHKVWLLKF